MSWQDFRLRLRALFFRRRMDEELEEELQFHIDMQAQKNQRTESNGVKAEREARLCAHLRPGVSIPVEKKIRDVRARYVPLSQHPSRSLDIVLRVTSSNLPQL